MVPLTCFFYMLKKGERGREEESESKGEREEA